MFYYVRNGKGSYLPEVGTVSEERNRFAPSAPVSDADYK